MKKAIYLLISVLALIIPFVTDANILPEDAPFATKALVISFFVIVPLLINALIEAVVGLIFVLSTKKSYKILLYQFVANIITFIPFFFLMYKFDLTRNYFALVVAEIIIVAVEAFIIKLLSKDKISTKQAVILSLIANIVSIATGIIVSNL